MAGMKIISYKKKRNRTEADIPLTGRDRQAFVQRLGGLAEGGLLILYAWA
jgi:hypothetical protein